VKLATAALLRRADVQIRLPSESTYSGAHVYSTDGSTQTKSQSTVNLTTAIYPLLIANDGNAIDTLTLTGTAGNASWGVRYFDALIGGNDITSAVIGAGWSTAPLAVQAGREVRVEVTPKATVAATTVFSTLATAMPAGFSSGKDVAKTVTTVPLNRQPDCSIRQSTVTAFIGGNLYNTDATGQNIFSSMPTSAVTTFICRLQNNGNATDTFKFTAIASGSGWSARYYLLASNVDITSLITGTGWPSGQLAQLAYKDIKVVFTPDTSIARGSLAAMTFMATSIGDATRQDCVKAIVYLQGTLTHPWPMFRQNAPHSGVSSANGPARSMVKWSFSPGSVPFTSPVVANTGVIYFTASDGRLFAVNPDGSQKWVYPQSVYGMSLPDGSTPAIGADGTVYALLPITDSGVGGLCALTPEGTVKWVFTAQGGGGSVIPSPVIAPDGMIYLAVAPYYNSSTLYAILPDGTLRWQVALSDPLIATPAVAAEGTIYLGTATGRFLAISSAGVIKWTSTISTQVSSSAAVGTDGIVYVGAQDMNLYAIKPDGSVKWSYPTGGVITSSPSIGADGVIYVGSGDKKMYAIKSDGTLKWSCTVGDIIMYSSPALDAAGTVYINAMNNLLYAIKADGTLKWSYRAVYPYNYYYTSPAIGADGTIYMTANDGALHAINQAKYQPDLHVRPLAVTTFTGADFYSLDGTDQQQAQTIAKGKTSSYVLRIQNDGSSADSITVTSAGNASGWTVQFADAATGGNDLTAKITGTGWSTVLLAPGVYKDIWLRMTPASTLTTGGTVTITLTAKSTGDPTHMDVVKTVTTVGP